MIKNWSVKIEKKPKFKCSSNYKKKNRITGSLVTFNIGNS